MERILIETSLGRVPVWGRWSPKRPLVVVIRGAFPPKEMFYDLHAQGADLAFLHLPGMYCDPFDNPSISAFVAAYDEVISQLFPGRDITAVGVSTGALAALALSSPEVRRVLCVEPFYATDHLWPLIEWVQRRLRKSPDNAHLKAFCSNLFGITLDGVSNVDYSGLLNRRSDQRRLALLGGEELGTPRPVAAWPSLCAGVYRDRLPGLIARGGGHELPTDAMKYALDVLLETTGSEAPSGDQPPLER